MKVSFTGMVELWSLTVFAELAVWEKRPELQRLCASGATIGDVEIDRALPGLSDTGRRNILRHLEQTRLVDAAGVLTSLGRACAKSGDAPAWELGVYNFLIATHPLFGHHVLDFERSGEDARPAFDGLASVPSWFVVEPDRIWTSAVQGGGRFSIQSLPAPRGEDPRCVAKSLAPAALRWELDPLSGKETPLFNIEVQLWVREVSRLLRTVDASPSFRWLDSGDTDDPFDPTPAIELPAVYCRHCGRSGWLATAAEFGDRLIHDPARTYRNLADNSATVRAMIRATASCAVCSIS